MTPLLLDLRKMKYLLCNESQESTKKVPSIYYHVKGFCLIYETSSVAVHSWKLRNTIRYTHLSCTVFKYLLLDNRCSLFFYTSKFWEFLSVYQVFASLPVFIFYVDFFSSKVARNEDLFFHILDPFVTCKKGSMTIVSTQRKPCELCRMCKKQL